MRRVAAALALAILAGCESLQSMPPPENPFKPPPLAVRVSESGASTPIVLVRGQTLVVVLEANVTTGYRWEAVPDYAPTLVALGTPDYTARTTPPAIGVPGDMTFRFRGDAPGKTTLELVYRRPFEPNVAPAKTLRYDVTVQ
jgi:inhibitor of cysteine peptidase